MEIYVESVKSYECGPWKVRVWRKEEDVKLIDDNDDMDVLEIIKKAEKFVTPSRSNLAVNVLNLEKVNAVEVKDETGFGVVLYRDWP